MNLPRRKTKAHRDAIRAGRKRRRDDLVAFAARQGTLIDPAFGRTNVRRLHPESAGDSQGTQQ